MAKPSAYMSEIQTWRKVRLERLQKPYGWLSLVSLDWLIEGSNTIKMPRGKALTATLDKHQNVEVKRGREILGRFDMGGRDLEKDQEFALDDIKVQIIRRSQGVGIRIRDPQNPARLKLKSLKWFSTDPHWKVPAQFEPYNSKKTIVVQTSTGKEQTLVAIGSVRFQIKGQDFSLMAFDEDGELFLPIRDKTSGKSTYAAARFLNVPLPQKNSVPQTVEIDFNKAYNPPCAFTRFATCPYPPPENHLAIAVEAGEKK